MSGQAPTFVRPQSEEVDVSEDKLTKLRRAASDYYALEQQIEVAESSLSDMKKRLLEITHRELPDLFAEVGVDSVGLEDSGVDVVVGPYYKASIPANLSPEEKAHAFSVLEELEGDDIIRAKLVVEFFKEELDDAKDLAEHIRTTWPKANLHPVNIDMSVPWATLTSFVREYTEDESTPTLTDEQKQALGATIGRVARIKKRKK